MNSEIKMKEQLVKHLQGGEAFCPLANMIDEISFEDIGKRSAALPYSFYELFYHIYYTQKDILDYCLAKDYKRGNWPDDYWPESQAPDSEEGWEDLKADYFENRNDLEDFVMHPETNLMAPVKNSEEHSALRELLLVIEHTSYHTGQLLILLRLLGLYKS